MKITLSAAVRQLEETLDQLDPETGELPEGFESIHAMVQQKMESVAAYILQEEAFVTLEEARAKELTAQAKSRAKRTAYLRQYLLKAMATTGAKEIKAHDGSLRIKRYPDRDDSLDVPHPELLPDDYWREIPATREPNKVLIKKAIKDGYPVPGAEIKYRDRLEIK